MFYDKLNYKEDGFYSVVDQVELVNGEYKGVLNHDHVDRGTILIIDEEGNEIKDYFISDNPEKPWETEIELFGSKGIKIAYIHYNTKGDIVDADDINKIQDAINTDDNSLEKVKEDIIVLKETKSDKRYVDKELEKKLDNDNFLEAMEEITEYTNNDLIPELKQYVDDLFADIPEVFHDLNQNVVTEDMNPGDFKHGVTICSQSSIDSFPSIKEYGVSITVRGVHASYAQLFITRYGDIWARRSGVIDEWNGDWYNSKKEIDKKADKDYVDEKIGDIDFTELEKEIDKKADKDYVDEKIGDIDFTELEKEIDKKADKSELDKVKQSGVETNKILVDALNSHDIQASTKDSIRVNVNKVNDIESGGGGYLPGDIIMLENLSEVRGKPEYDWDWSTDYGDIISVDIGQNNDIYFATKTYAFKLTHSGRLVWSVNLSSYDDIVGISHFEGDQVFVLCGDTRVVINDDGYIWYENEISGLGDGTKNIFKTGEGIAGANTSYVAIDNRVYSFRGRNTTASSPLPFSSTVSALNTSTEDRWIGLENGWVHRDISSGEVVKISNYPVEDLAPHSKKGKLFAVAKDKVAGINLKDNTIMWEKNLNGGKSIDVNMDSNTIVVGTSNGDVLGLGLDGVQLWDTAIGGSVNFVKTIPGTGKTIYITGNKIIALGSPKLIGYKILK